MLNVRLQKNFIKDLTGIDCYTNERIHSIVGFYVLAIDTSSTNEDECNIFYTGKAEFVNVDNKFNKLITNLYTDNSESISQGSNFKKLYYVYEVLHENENPRIENNQLIFKNDETYKDNSITKLAKLKYLLGNDFRIAFEIYNKSNDIEMNNKNVLASIIAYEGFRPIIDVHSLKILTNLISITTERNSIFHVHDLGKLEEINLNTEILDEYKDYSVNSLINFKSPNKPFDINQSDVCFEDWNLINLEI